MCLYFVKLSIKFRRAIRKRWKCDQLESCKVCKMDQNRFFCPVGFKKYKKSKKKKHDKKWISKQWKGFRPAFAPVKSSTQFEIWDFTVVCTRQKFYQFYLKFSNLYIRHFHSKGINWSGKRFGLFKFEVKVIIDFRVFPDSLAWTLR